MMNRLKNLFKNYWIVILVGVYFTLTCIYNEFGVWRSVEWNVFAKLNREIFVSILLFKYRNVLNNILSMLFCYGALAYVWALSFGRLWCAYIALNSPELIGLEKTEYDIYTGLLKNGSLRLTFSIIIFVILLLIKYANKIEKWLTGLRKILFS